MNETFVRLSEDQMHLILFALEQQESDFNPVEQSLCEAIIDTFTTALVEMNRE
jgi:hypothetical protein